MTDSAETPGSILVARGPDFVCAINALAIALMWLSFVSGGFTADGLVDGVYEIQAASLAQGQLTITPGPASLFYHDALMYWGQYYFYWGLLPSAALSVLAAIFGRLAAHYLLVFAFFFSLAFFFQKILHRILVSASPTEGRNAFWGLLFSTVGSWIFLFVIPYPAELGWFFGRFIVYEQQILFGLALAMPGIYLLMVGFSEKRADRVALAALAFSLAAWTRVTWFPFAGFVLGTACFLTWRWRSAEGPLFGSKGTRAALIAAFVLMLGVLLVNYVRFDSPFDFGVRYQNPGHYAYFRNLKLFFSPETKLWNALFNVVSYVAWPELVQRIGLYDRAYAHWEGYPPSFFFFNPLFLSVLVLIPFAAYRAWKRRSPLLVPIGVLGGTIAYLCVVIALFGTMVIVRYFVECYYFLLFLFIGCVLVFLRPTLTVPLFVIMLASYVPETAVGLWKTDPELRAVTRTSGGYRLTSPGSQTPLLEPKAVWPLAAFSVEHARSLPPYAMMGVQDGGGGNLLGQDIWCVYLVPKDVKPSAIATLVLRGLKAISGSGTVLIFFENRLVGKERVTSESTVNAYVKLPFPIHRQAPYQVMVIFLDEGQAYLPGRGTGKPRVLFREVLFEVQSTQGSSRDSETERKH